MIALDHTRWQCSARLERAVWAAGAFLLWAIPSVDLLDKFLGKTGAAAAAAAALVAILLAARLMQGWSQAIGSRHALLLISIFLLVIAFVVLFPIAKSGSVGLGSDRDDALNVAIRALLHGNYPYHLHTYLGNPPTPMPGALLLATPFYLLGTAALQNLFWVPIFVRSAPHLFGSDGRAAAYVLVFLLFCPVSLQDFVTGGDYLVNCLYVVLAIEFVFGTCGARTAFFKRWAAYAYLAICLSSRPIFVVLVPILAAFVRQRAGRKRALEFFGIVAMLCLIINGPFYLYDPAAFPALKLSRKLADFPPDVHAAWLIPALSLALAAGSFTLRLNRRRIYAVATACLAVMFVPLYAYQLLSGATSALLGSVGYAIPLTVFGGIWVMQTASAVRQFDGATGLGAGDAAAAGPASD